MTENPASDVALEKVLEHSRHLGEEVDRAAIFSRDQAAALQRWVMASCLTVNAGGALSVLSLEGIDQNSRFWASFWFASGAVAAIIFGIVAGWVSSSFGGYYLRAAWKFKKFSAGLLGGELPDLEMKRFDQLLGREKIIPWLQSASLVLFIIGLVIAGEGLA